MLHFKSSFTPAEKENFKRKLPKRSDYINPHKLAVNNKYFLPIYVKDVNHKLNKSLQFCIVCTGVDLDGNKLGLIITDYMPYFDVRVPPNTMSSSFQGTIETLIFNTFDSGFVPKYKIEVITATMALYYQPKSTFLRISFMNNIHRKRLHTAIKDGFQYTDMNGNINTYTETPYTDDLNHLHRFYSRNTKQRFCEWWRINDAIPEDTYFKSGVKGYKISYKNIIRVEDTSKEAELCGISNDVFLKDHTMEMTWDLETISFKPTGQAPDYNNIMQSGEITNQIFMDSIAVFWYWQKVPLVVICITDMPTPPRKDCIIIKVSNSAEIIMVKAMVVDALMPDIMTAFNGDQYDWPFVRATISAFDGKSKGFANNFRKYMSVMRGAEDYETSKWSARDWCFENIKFEGGSQITSEFYDAMGLLVFDIRTIFRKIYVNAEESNLNFYLEKERLQPKADMAYSRMFAIYILLKTLEQYYNIYDFDELVAAYKANPPEQLPMYKFNTAYLTPGSDFYISSNLDVVSYMQDSTLVVNYCNIDAIACHELTLKRNIIGDKRKWANLAYVNMYDTIYFADGMKVRNIIMAEGMDWGLIFPVSIKCEKNKKKYPGAIVIDPKKGFYKAHQYEKRTRRESFKSFATLYPNKISEEVKRTDFNIIYPLSDEENMNNEMCDESDRPMGACDFSSLYPNVDISINGSPEKVLRRREDAPKDAIVLETTFEYDIKDKKGQKEVITAYILQYNKETLEGMGLYPTILRKMYIARSKVKKDLGPFEAAKKLLEKCNITLPLEPQLQDKINKARIDAEQKQKEYYYDEYNNIKKTVEFINSLSGTSAEIYDYVVFYYNYYNASQLAIKIFMNTFYGDTGNSTSPLFMVEIAASITTHGRYNLGYVKDFSLKNNFKILYGDTDSLYLAADNIFFKEVDEQYLNGEIDRLKYWELMIDITQDELEKFKKKVNKYLVDLHTTPFLAVDTEGVAYPYMLCGKKKYIMLKHIGVSNLALCNAQQSESVAKCPNLDVRGFEIKKRGSSMLLKKVFYNILLNLFSVKTNDQMITLVENALLNIKNEQYPLKDFIKSAKYTPAKAGKQGNVTVLSFISRMKDLVTTTPNIGITLPMPSDRFKFVIVKRNEQNITLRGTKGKVSVGDKYEFYDSFANERYKALIGDIQPDIDYYIENEITGQLARLLTYHPTFDKYFTEGVEFKVADQKAHSDAKKHLLKLFATIKDPHTDIDTKFHKEVFKKANKEVRQKLSNIDGVAILDTVNKLVTELEVDDKGFADKMKFLSDAVRLLDDTADKLAEPVYIDMITPMLKKFELIELHNLYSPKNCHMQKRIYYLNGLINQAKIDLSKNINALQNSLYNYRKSIQAIRDMYLRGEICNIQVEGIDADLLSRTNKSFERLVDLIRSKRTCENIVKQVRYKYDEQSKCPNLLPCSLNKQDIRERYLTAMKVYAQNRSQKIETVVKQPNF